MTRPAPQVAWLSVATSDEIRRVADRYRRTLVELLELENRLARLGVRPVAEVAVDGRRKFLDRLVFDEGRLR